MCIRDSLNGLLFDLRDATLRCVATDGHRLALCEAALDGGSGSKRQIIVPRKGVQEPVSYTHLDVYKRQACNASKPNCRWRMCAPG